MFVKVVHLDDKISAGTTPNFNIYECSHFSFGWDLPQSSTLEEEMMRESLLDEIEQEYDVGDLPIEGNLYLHGFRDAVPTHLVFSKAYGDKAIYIMNDVGKTVEVIRIQWDKNRMDIPLAAPAS